MNSTVEAFDDFDNIQLITSWADFVEETEADTSDLNIPDWAVLDFTVKAQNLEPSLPVHKGVENRE